MWQTSASHNGNGVENIKAVQLQFQGFHLDSGDNISGSGHLAPREDVPFQCHPSQDVHGLIEQFDQSLDINMAESMCCEQESCAPQCHSDEGQFHNQHKKPERCSYWLNSSPCSISGQAAAGSTSATHSSTVPSPREPPYNPWGVSHSHQHQSVQVTAGKVLEMRIVHVYDSRWPVAGLNEIDLWPSYEGAISSVNNLKTSVMRVFNLSEDFQLFLKEGQAWCPFHLLDNIPSKGPLCVGIERIEGR